VFDIGSESPMRALKNIVLAIVVLLVVMIGGFVALNWAPDRPVATLKARWAQPPSVFVSLDGMDVHLRDEAPRDDPMPIVLIHGTSSNLHTWDGWATGLAKTRRVVRMDLPGFGLTGPAPDGDYSPQRYSHFVVDVLDKLSISRAVLVGNSLGGSIAWLTAATRPDRVAKLILIDSGGYPIQSVSVPVGFRIARMPVLNHLMDFVLPRGIIESSVRNVYGDPSKVTPALIDQYYEMTLRAGNRHALAQRMAQGDFTPFDDGIKTIKQPTLILWGGQDRLIPPANAAHFHADIANSQVIMFDHLGHVPQEEDPAATLAAALPFLSATN
jgi:pimeloyl-ACP methyl ester carboxylesterase